MKIVVFPGQGSQKINMSKDIYDRYSFVKSLFQEAEEISAIPLSKIIFNGSEEDLKRTTVSQVAIMLACIATLRVLEETLETKISNFSSIISGHSLGEYTALVAAGALSFKDAVYLLTVRGKAMETAFPTKGGMLAVIGINDIETIKEIANKASINNLTCEVANDNANGQVILSGNIEALELAAKIAKDEYKAKIVKFLEVSGPFHSSLMKKAAAELEKGLNKIAINKLNIPVISNVTAKKIENEKEIKKLLLKQIVSPVRWRESIQFAANLGVETLIEIGPNKVLTGLTKRIDNNIKCVNIETIEDINNVEKNIIL